MVAQGALNWRRWRARSMGGIVGSIVMSKGIGSRPFGWSALMDGVRRNVAVSCKVIVTPAGGGMRW